jgi:hypothetical protein
MDNKMKIKYMIRERRKRIPRAINRAQGLVEFALVLPVILITLFVLVELARVLHAWLSIENGARAGIRYAVTAEYNPDYCPPTGCETEDDEKAARIASIHDAAWAGSSSIVRAGWDDVEADESGFFDVIVCPPKKLIEPASTFDTYYCDKGENPGNPGDQVVVVVEFNHPLISPLLTSIWPQLRLDAKRQAIVETYRVPMPVGTAPAFDSPTPKPTNTSWPTNTPGSEEPPSCEYVHAWGKGDPIAGWAGFEIVAYPVDEKAPGGFYELNVIEIKSGFSNAYVNGWEWITWNQGGQLDPETTDYGGYTSSFTDITEYNVGLCHPGSCSDVYYRGRFKVYFGSPLGAMINFRIKAQFKNGPTCDLGWKSYKNPNFPTETPQPYISDTPNPNPDPTDTPTPTWVPAIPTPTLDPNAPPD